MLSGRDLLVALPDGSHILIIDGAVYVPTLVVGNVELPPVNLAALLVGEEPQPAAGPPQSSGGNFAEPVGDIGRLHGLGDLLPPTELHFGLPEYHELFPAPPNRLPSVSIIVENSPVAVTDAVTSVDEAGLPARGSKPAGSNFGSNSETTTGAILFDPGDPPSWRGINGVGITGVGQTFKTSIGVLTLTGVTDGRVEYSYTLTNNTLDPSISDHFTVMVVDSNGDTVKATLTVNVIDDVPTAHADADSVTEDGPLVADGNVLTGHGGHDANTTDGVTDVQGADGAHVATTGIFRGHYGVLTLNADGSYHYVLDNANPVVQGLSAGESLKDSFNYTIVDGDGDTSGTTLTITVNGANDGVIISGLDVAGGEVVVNEADLPGGSSPDAAALTQTGHFSFAAPDGLANVSVGGVQVVTAGAFAAATVTTAIGTLNITAFTSVTSPDGSIIGGTFSYSYVLFHSSLGHSVQGTDNILQSFAVVVTDSDGSRANASLDVKVIDDVPTAHADSGTVIEGAALTATADHGVLANDVAGADGFAPGGAVVGVAAGSNTGSPLSGDVGSTVTGAYGALTLNADGSYSYASVAGSVPSGGATDSFTYTVKDADGDTSTTVVTFKLVDSGLAVTPDSGTVFENALNGIGSNPGSNAETISGTVADNLTNGTAPFSFSLLSPAVGTHGTLTFNPDGSYSYTLTSPVHSITADNGANVVDSLDSFQYRAIDANGNTVSSTISINVVDDVPTAVNDPAIGIAEDAARVSGNVMANDVPGADSAMLTSVTINGAVTAIASSGTTSVSTANGAYAFHADGSWTFDPNSNLDNAAGVDASFSYRITDGDGDTATATQPITVFDGAGPVAGAPIALHLDDQNLPDGSTPGGPLASSADLVFTPGSDSIASVAFSTDLSGLGAGLSWSLDPTTQTITGSLGGTTIVTIALVRVGDSAHVTATLDHNYPLHPIANVDDLQALGQVGVIATDIDGDQATGIVTIDISDDLPTISLSGVAPVLTVDETNLAVDAVASFAGIFAPDFGADGAGTVSYALGISATASGLTDTLTGEAVMLSLSGGVVQGRTQTSNFLVFTVSVDGGGNVTLDQLRAIVHADATNPDDVKSLDAGLITLGATVTDGDGDTASASANIGASLQFRDDGPHAVNDSNSTTEGGPAMTGNVLANDMVGADIPGAVIAVSGGGIGAPISTGHGILTLNADGSYNYAPNASVPSGTTDVFTYIMRDADGDTSQATLTISFSGDANKPTAATAQATVDDEGLTGGIPGGAGDINANIGDNPSDISEASFTGNLGYNFGLDGQAAGGAFVFANGSGTVGIETVNYNWDSLTNILTATIAGGARAGTALFTVSVTPSTGAYTVHLLDNVLQAPGGNENNASAALGYTVTDSDGSTASGTLNIMFNDDMPTLGTIQNGTANNDPTSAVSVGTLHFASGADGVGPMGAISLTSTDITSGGHAIVTQQVGNVLTGYADVDGSGTLTAGDTSVFTLTINTSAGTSGQYVFDLAAPLDGAINSMVIGGSHAFGAGPTQSQVLDTTGGATNLAVVSGWLTGASFDAAHWYDGTNPLPSGLTLAAVNGSTAGWGVDNNNFTSGEFMRFDFGSPMDDFDGAGPYVAPSLTLPEVSYATFSLIGYGGADAIQFRVHYTDGSSSNATASGAALSSPFTLTAPIGKHIDWIDLYTPNAGGGGKINLTSVGAQSVTVDRTLGFSVTLNDGDSDPVTGSFTVNVKDGNSASTPVAPVVLDLNGDGLHFLGLSSGVIHDYGSGAVPTSWIGADDGLLARNPGGGRLDIVFTDDAAGAKTDLEGLRLAYDSNGDGKLTAADAAFGSFGVWQDANSNGVTDPGEFKSLTALGISSISLTASGVGYTTANGDVTVTGEALFTRTDGTTGKAADVSFATGGQVSVLENSKVPENSGLNQALVAAGLVGAVGLMDAHSPRPDHVALEKFAGLLQQDVSSTRGLQTAHDHVADAPQDGNWFAGWHVEGAKVPAAHPVSSPDMTEKSVHGEEMGSLRASATDRVAHEQGGQDGGTDHDAGASAASAMPVVPLQGVENGAALLAAIRTVSVGQGHQQDMRAAVAGHGPHGTLAEILADALAGGKGGPDINALLEALPSAGAPHAMAMQAGTVAVALSHDMGHFAMAAMHMGMAGLSHDAVAGTVHA